MISPFRTEAKTRSSATYKIGYDEKTRILTVQMMYSPPKNHGEILRYSGVPKKVFEEFLRADSHGSYFNSKIRNSYNLIGK